MVIFIVWIVFIRLEQKTNLNLTKKVCKNKDFWNVAMPSEGTRILEFSEYQKFDKTAFIIYADLESLIKKDGWM